MFIKFSLIGALLAVGLAPSVSVAAVITDYFGDRAGFEAAVSGEINDNLNTAPLGSFKNSTLDLGDYSITHSGPTGFTASIEDSSGFTVDGTRHGRIDTGTCCGDLTFTFDKAIIGFGLDADALNDTIIRTPIFIDGVAASVNLGPDQNSTFVGYVSDTPFTTILFKGDSGDSWGFDNIVYAPAAIPLPAGVWLLGSGLFGLTLMRRRQKNRTA